MGGGGRVGEEGVRGGLRGGRGCRGIRGGGWKGGFWGTRTWLWVVGGVVVSVPKLQNNL